MEREKVERGERRLLKVRGDEGDEEKEREREGERRQYAE